MKRLLAIVGLVFGAVHTHGGDTNFVSSFNLHWRGNNASNILAFTETQLAGNRCVETLFARGIVAFFLQDWGRGATNYFGQAIRLAETNAVYSASGKTNVVRVVAEINGAFEVIIDDTQEPAASTPAWKTNGHLILFNEFNNEVPFLNELKRISTVE
jgi:hypothetical protein